MDKKTILADVVNRMIYECTSLEHISEDESGIKIVVSCFIRSRPWLRALIDMFGSMNKRNIYEVTMLFKGVSNKSGTAFVDGYLMEKFTNTTEPERDIEKFFIIEKEGQYWLGYEGDAGHEVILECSDYPGFLTMAFSFEDCEFNVELIRDGDLELR